MLQRTFPARTPRRDRAFATGPDQERGIARDDIEEMRQRLRLGKRRPASISNYHSKELADLIAFLKACQ